MSEKPIPILHHYPGSPFAEKIRLMLGYKSANWQSVLAPSIMPKPDLTALTGGYRRIPVLQQGADVYCDTRLIARKIDQLLPRPPIGLRKCAGVSESLACWIDDHLFRIAVALVFSPQGLAGLQAYMGAEEMQALVKDRQETMFAAATVPHARLELDVANSHLQAYLDDFERQLNAPAANACLFGDNPCVADFSLYHCLWFLKSNPACAHYFETHPAVNEWMGLMAQFGHGNRLDIDSKQALKTAAEAEPAAVEAVVDSQDFAPGDQVRVIETALGIDPVAGELRSATGDEIIILRQSKECGEVAVHFPMVGYRLESA